MCCFIEEQAEGRAQLHIAYIKITHNPVDPQSAPPSFQLPSASYTLMHQSLQECFYFLTSHSPFIAVACGFLVTYLYWNGSG